MVTTQDGKFPQDIKLECLKEKAEMLDSLKENDDVSVKFDLSGREWQGKYFVNLTAWKIDTSSSSGEDDIPQYDPSDEVDFDSEEPPF